MEADEFIPLSEIADSIKCIKLQIDSGDAMGRIREIIIKKKYIYAVDISQQVISSCFFSILKLISPELE